MFDLEQSVVDALKNLVASGELTEMVKKHMASTLNDIVSSALRSYGDIGKQIQAAVTQALAIDPKQIGLTGYNQTVLAVIRQQLDASIQQIGVEKLKASLEELLGTNAPAEIKLSVLIEQFKEWAGKEHGSGDECTIIFKESQYKSRWLYLDKGERTEPYKCQFSLLIGDDGDVVMHKIDNRDPKTTVLMGKVYGFEKTLFQMYAAGTKVIVDETEFDNSLERDYDR